jgi:hypothetical protein
MQGTIEKTIELIEAQRRQIDEMNAVGIRSDPDLTPLDFLRGVYCNEGLPLAMRMRAAIEAAPYVHPKLSATALIAPGADFGAKLEKAIARSRQATRLIEHNPAS